MDHNPDAIRITLDPRASTETRRRGVGPGLYHVTVVDEERIGFDTRVFSGPDEADRWADSWWPLPLLTATAGELYADLTGACHGYLGPNVPCPACGEVGADTPQNRARRDAILGERAEDFEMRLR
jgi:hypothetical protein